MLPLKISAISKSFNRLAFNRTVLSDVSLEVKPNEIFGFIGLNGQGKTTLIKIILDLLDCYNGEVEIFGVPCALPQARKKICYLPEKFQPSIHQKGEEFLRFVLGFYGKKFDAEKAHQTCENLDLPFAVLSQKISGKTIFFSSHILSDMDEICDTIAVLNNSKITYHGSPQGFKTKHQEDNLDKAFLAEIGIR